MSLEGLGPPKEEPSNIARRTKKVSGGGRRTYKKTLKMPLNGLIISLEGRKMSRKGLRIPLKKNFK